ncbi:MAG TPA: trypsin-like peptidase domain-containing protein [Kofleriaceae bacterium]
MGDATSPDEGGSDGKSDGADVPLLDADARYRAIGRLRTGGTSCTAFLIDNGGGADAPAYVIANGHCTNKWAEAGSSLLVARNVPVMEGDEVDLGYFHDATPVRVGVRAIPYATMKTIDLAVIELAETRAALEDKGIQPLAWADAAPKVGAKIAVVGAPLYQPDFLRKVTCTEQGTRSVFERNWRWPELHRNRCIGIISGSSGSPMLDEHDRVFAVLNTTTRGANPDAACWVGAPCEVGATGFDFSPDTNYGASITWLRACFDAEGRFAPAAAGCKLDDGRQLQVTELPYFRDRPTGTWGVALASAHGMTEYRYKVDSCEDATGYSAPRAIDQQLATLAVPTAEGPHTLCIVGGAGTSWQTSAHATPVQLYIDLTPPARKARVNFERWDGRVSAEPIFSPPELSHFTYVSVAPTASCEDSALVWQPYRRFPVEVISPGRFCLRAEDVAGNVGPIHVYEVE